MIDTLPIELFSECLILASPANWSKQTDEVLAAEEIRDYLGTIRCVCARWDAIALATPRLWTSVLWDSKRVHYTPSFEDFSNILDVLRTQMHRSIPHPMHLTFHHADSDLERTVLVANELAALVNEVKRQSGRVRSLSMYAPNPLVWFIVANWTALRKLTLRMSWRASKYESGWFEEPLLTTDVIPCLEYLCIHDQDSSPSHNTPWAEDPKWLKLLDQNYTVFNPILRGIRPTSLEVVHLHNCDYLYYDFFLRQCNLKSLCMTDCTDYGAYHNLEPLIVSQVSYSRHVALFSHPCKLFSHTLTHACLKWRSDSNYDEDLEDSDGESIDMEFDGTIAMLSLIVVNLVHDESCPESLGELLDLTPALRALRIVRWLNNDNIDNVLRIMLSIPVPSPFSNVPDDLLSVDDPDSRARHLELLELLIDPWDAGKICPSIYDGPELLQTLLQRRPRLQVNIGIAVYEGEPTQHPILASYQNLVTMFPGRLAFPLIDGIETPPGFQGFYSKSLAGQLHHRRIFRRLRSNRMG